MKRFQIQTLRSVGLSHAEVAAQAGVSRSTARRVAKEDPVEKALEKGGRVGSKMGRPSRVARFAPLVEGWLREEPRLSSVAILERLREEGYEGGKTAVYDLVRRLRPVTSADLVARFEALPGEFSQHDFGQVEVRYEDGSRERVRFFASRLKFSRMIRVRLVGDEKTETVCHSLFDAFTYFGGVPLQSVFDNPKTIVVSRDGDKVKWQETFAQFCLEGGIVPRVTWPRCPQQKGSVENLVGFVKSSFFKVHRFRDREDLESKLEEWHRRVNEERPSRATGEIPRVRFLLEEPRLRPLGFPPSGYTLKFTRQVRTDGFCEFEGLRYFVGRDHVGQIVTLHVGETTVRVYRGPEDIASHPRRPVNGKYSVLPEQRSEMLTKPGARLYVKRQLLVDLCPAAEWFLTEVRHRRPNQWKDEVERLFELLETRGEVQLRAAFAEAGRRSVIGSEYLEAILDESHGGEVER